MGKCVGVWGKRRCKEMLEEVWESVLGCGKVKGKCGEVCWGVGGGEKKCRRSVLECEGKCEKVLGRSGEMLGEV